MKTTRKDLLILLLTIMLMFSNFAYSFSQEGGYWEGQSQDKPGKPSTFEGDGIEMDGYGDPDQEEKNQKDVSAEQGAEKAVVKKEPTKVKKTTTKDDEDGESVLSFNFIYYIIQKFKFSDILY